MIHTKEDREKIGEIIADNLLGEYTIEICTDKESGELFHNILGNGEYTHDQAIFTYKQKSDHPGDIEDWANFNHVVDDIEDAYFNDMYALLWDEFTG